MPSRKTFAFFTPQFFSFTPTYPLKSAYAEPNGDEERQGGGVWELARVTKLRPNRAGLPPPNRPRRIDWWGARGLKFTGRTRKRCRGTAKRPTQGLRFPVHPAIVISSPRAFDWYPFRRLTICHSATKGVAVVAVTLYHFTLLEFSWSIALSGRPARNIG